MLYEVSFVQNLLQTKDFPAIDKASIWLYDSSAWWRERTRHTDRQELIAHVHIDHAKVEMWSLCSFDGLSCYLGFVILLKRAGDAITAEFARLSNQGGAYKVTRWRSSVSWSSTEIAYGTRSILFLSRWVGMSPGRGTFGICGLSFCLFEFAPEHNRMFDLRCRTLTWK